ncbi:hypothetical protein GCM10027053_09060 [Intrasporangium mesophilum]
MQGAPSPTEPNAATGRLVDRPVPDPRGPARWALFFGGLSLVPMGVRAGNAAALDAERAAAADSGSVLALPANDIEQWWANACVATFVVAGVFACIWLVRLQYALVRRGALTRVVPDLGFWVMWVLPIVTWILPVVRINRLDRALRPRTSWRDQPFALWAWAAVWVLMADTRLWSPRGLGEMGAPLLRAVLDVDVAWWRLGVAVAAYVLWYAVVVRITDAADRAQLASPGRVQVSGS